MPIITDLKGPAGRLEALLEAPESGEPRAAVVFAHPHPQFGGTMHTKAVYHGA
jgi:alpha/beta superfamily hydrolase